MGKIIGMASRLATGMDCSKKFSVIYDPSCFAIGVGIVIPNPLNHPKYLIRMVEVCFGPQEGFKINTGHEMTNDYLLSDR